MADFITNTEMKGPYRWDFPIKNKNMDKPTSEKDVIKSLSSERLQITLARAIVGEFKASRKQGQEDSIQIIKPVFDKMLAALKSVVACEDDEGGDRSEDERYRIVYEAIKEAEELGL